MSAQQNIQQNVRHKNVQQNVRHKNVDFQCKSIELTPWYISASFDPLPNKNIRGFLSLFTIAPLWEYIIR